MAVLDNLIKLIIDNNCIYVNIVKLKFRIIEMTNLLVRESQSYSHTTATSNNLKKIKHYSYSGLDKIGKGFSSIVYRGTN
jgi:uncharacterized protein YxeA